MNFLAHFYLAFNDPDLLLGQFISDDIKGRKYENYPDRIRQGILLHRFIDSTTDFHPDCLYIRRLIRPELGLFSPVAIDLFFDHILAIKWHTYSSIDLRQFASEVYGVLENHKSFLSPKMLILLTKMKQYDWLSMYESAEGMSEIMVQMSRRIRGGQALGLAGPLLQKHLIEVEKSFDSFFPQLINDSKAKLDTFAT
jgi:acyl carrier protein phosphodiesterase